MTVNMSRYYEQAQEIIQGYLTNKLVLNDAVFPHWVETTGGEDSSIFWYVRETDRGKEYRVVNADTANNSLAFDHEYLSLLLSDISEEKINPHDLPISDVSFLCSPFSMIFTFLGERWIFDKNKIYRNTELSYVKGEVLISPDGEKSVYLEDCNIWLRDERSGESCPLTYDGVEDNCYATALFFGWDKDIQACWSPDSKRIFTVQLDSRGVRTRPVLSYVPRCGDVHPKLDHYKLAYPDDCNVDSYKLVVIDVESKEVIRVKHPAMPYVLHGPESFGGFFTGNLGWWSSSDQYAYFVDVSRGSRKVSLMKLDTFTGIASVLFEEESDTYVQLCDDSASAPMFMPLLDSDELIWCSERSGWLHLYLYDMNTGELKHKITGDNNFVNHDNWLVRGVLHFDPVSRELLLQTAARDQSISPYYRDICKVNIDTCEIIPIISGPFDFYVCSVGQGFCIGSRSFYKIDNTNGLSGVSPCGKYIITTYSRVDTIPVTALFDRYGNKVATIEVADVSGLPPEWSWPSPVKLKAADGKTDIYGAVFTPPGYSSEVSYPVIDFMGGTSYLNLMPQGSFVNSHFSNYFEMAALAALGFIVVGILGRGTLYRGKEFKDHGFNKPSCEDDLNDHVAGIRQLTAIYPNMNIQSVGITAMESTSNVIYGALIHSDFYKVTVCHVLTDPRDALFLYEMYYGIHDAETLNSFIGPESFVESFDGKLLLINGLQNTTDATFRLVDALQKNNKDFDMLCLPNTGAHITSYTRRRGWDYFVDHLSGRKPPKQFPLISSEDLLLANPNVHGTDYYHID